MCDPELSDGPRSAEVLLAWVNNRLNTAGKVEGHDGKGTPRSGDRSCEPQFIKEIEWRRWGGWTLEEPGSCLQISEWEADGRHQCAHVA